MQTATLGAKDSLVYVLILAFFVAYYCKKKLRTESMRLSIECSGCKATLTSGSNLAPATPKKEKPKMKKERRVAETGISRDHETNKRDGRSCPPSSPRSRNCGNTRKKLLSPADYFDLSSKCSDGGSCSLGGDEEEEIGTRFSSKSFSSEYSSSKYYDNNNGNVIKNKIMKKEKVAAVKVDRGVAVVEQSSDPYGDFRRSMVEMIMARRRLRDGDLSRLLRSYLLLNPPQHHPVILKAFTDLYMGSSIEHHLIS